MKNFCCCCFECVVFMNPAFCGCCCCCGCGCDCGDAVTVAEANPMATSGVVGATGAASVAVVVVVFVGSTSEDG